MNIFSEGDRKAYYESSQWTIRQNKDKILKLRSEVKELQKVKADRLAVSNFIRGKNFPVFIQNSLSDYTVYFFC